MVMRPPLAADEPVIDWALAQKLAGGNQDLAQTLIQELIRTLPADRIKINQAFDTYDLDTLRDQIHRLHGACCYCGVPALRLSLKNMHTALTHMPPILHCVAHAVQKVNQAIDQLLNMNMPMEKTK